MQEHLAGAPRRTKVVWAACLVSGGIFLAESTIMTALGFGPTLSPPAHALLDALLLTAVTFPLLYLFLGRPAERYRARLEAEIRDRETAEAKLAANQQHLATLVDERTADLRVANQRLGALLENLPQGVVFVDAEGRLLHANRVARDYLPVLVGDATPEHLPRLGGVPLDELLDGHPPGTRRELCLERPAPQVFEVAGTRLEGEGAGVVVIHDVTREREAEKRLRMQERLASVGQLAAGIAHDFNNILQSISLSGELVLRRRHLLSEEDRKATEGIVRQAERGALLVRKVLDFSRKSLVSKRVVDLGTLVQDFAQLIRRTIPENVHVRVSGQDGPLPILADPGAVNQVLMNLALNARDAMPAGGTLELALSRAEVDSVQSAPFPGMQPGAYVELRVTDDGPGVPEELRGRVFEPFFTTKPEEKGTGLGLAQVYGIVKQHGGWIVCSAATTGGAQFSLYLPLSREAVTGADAQAGAEAAQAPGNGRTVLVVEDNPSILEVIRENLRVVGYNVLIALDAHQALEHVRSHRGAIAAVLSDMVMPGMSGAALRDRLADLAPGVPVILMTGYPLGENADTLPSSGQLWLQKPFTLGELTATLDAALRDPIHAATP